MPATKKDLREWVVEALRFHGGGATILAVCRYIWQVHESDLRMAGDLFFSWQYDVRWAAHDLRAAGVMKPDSDSPQGVWELA